MMSLLVTSGIFFFFLGLHVLVHRVLWTRGIVTMKSMAVYIPGPVVILLLWKIGILAYPLSSVVLYMLILSAFAPMYLAMTLEGQTPASLILAAFSRKKTRTFRELSALFTEKGLFWDRIDTLLLSGFIRKKADRYTVTPRGQLIVGFMTWYRVIFNRPLGG